MPFRWHPTFKICMPVNGRSNGRSFQWRKAMVELDYLSRFQNVLGGLLKLIITSFLCKFQKWYICRCKADWPCATLRKEIPEMFGSRYVSLFCNTIMFKCGLTRDTMRAKMTGCSAREYLVPLWGNSVADVTVTLGIVGQCIIDSPSTPRRN